MNPKHLGAVQLIGAILAVIVGFMDLTFWAIIIFAILFIVLAIHHLTEVPAAAPPAGY